MIQQVPRKKKKRRGTLFSLLVFCVGCVVLSSRLETVGFLFELLPLPRQHDKTWAGGGVLYYNKSLLEHTHPVDLNYGVSVRLRGLNQTLSLEQAMEHPRFQSMLQEARANNQKLPIGVTIIEDNSVFWGLAREGYFHMYHYLEMILVAYMASLRLAGPGTSSLRTSSLQLKWVHGPHLTRDELRGTNEINQLVTDLVFAQTTVLGTIPLKGLEDNDDVTQKIHPSYRGALPDNQPPRQKRRARQRRSNSIPKDDAVRLENWRHMTDAVDAVIFVNREKCYQQGVNQMHAILSDDGVFPAKAWRRDVEAGLSSSGNKNQYSFPSIDSNSHNNNLVVCYIDRQQAVHRAMPDEEHEWLVDTLLSNQNVEFRDLHMERYPGLEQIQLASQCDLMVGVHGNGLSHQLWMKPGSRVVEYFWDNDFVFCYSILARMMTHKFLGFWRGSKMDTKRVLGKDPTVRREFDLNSELRPLEARETFLKFLHQAIQEKKKQTNIIPTLTPTTIETTAIMIRHQNDGGGVNVDQLQQELASTKHELEQLRQKLAQLAAPPGTSQVEINT